MELYMKSLCMLFVTCLISISRSIESEFSLTFECTHMFGPMEIPLNAFIRETLTITISNSSLTTLLINSPCCHNISIKSDGTRCSKCSENGTKMCYVYDKKVSINPMILDACVNESHISLSCTALLCPGKISSNKTTVSRSGESTGCLPEGEAYECTKYGNWTKSTCTPEETSTPSPLPMNETTTLSHIINIPNENTNDTTATEENRMANNTNHTSYVNTTINPTDSYNITDIITESPTNSFKHSLEFWLVVISCIILGIFVILSIVLLYHCYCKRMRRNKYTRRHNRHHDGQIEGGTNENVEEGMKLTKLHSRISKHSRQRYVSHSNSGSASDESWNNQNETYVNVNFNHLDDIHCADGMRRNEDTNIVQSTSMNDDAATNLKSNEVAAEMCIISPKIKVLDSVLEYNSTAKIDSKSTECFKDGNIEKDDSNTTPVKEKCFKDDRNVTICIVKPLMSPDPEICKKNATVQCKAKGFDVCRLDWNKIFTFLVRKVKPDEWRIFVNILLGGISSKLPDHETVDCKVARIKADNKNFNEMVLECLNYWKQLMASDACPCHIEEASKETGWNDVVQDFIDFMRVPPMLASVNQNMKSVEAKKYELATWGPTFPLVYINPDPIQLSCFPLQLTSTGNATGPVIEEVEERSIGPSGKELMKSNKRKHTSYLGEEECMNGDRTSRVIKCRKHEQCHTFKRSRSSTKHKKERFKPDETHLLKKCIVNLIEKNPPSSSMPLEKMAYNIFLKYTVKNIMLKTKESRKTILSLKYIDYCDVEKFETKRKDTFYVIYSANKRLTLGKKEYEKLKLYVENARRNRIEQLKSSANGRYKEPEALFLNYNGEPTLTNALLIRRRRHTTTSSRSCTDSDLSSPTEENQSQCTEAAGCESDVSFDSSTDSEVMYTDDNVSERFNIHHEAKKSATTVQSDRCENCSEIVGMAAVIGNKTNDTQ